MRAVTRGEASIGVLPIENSLAGAIPETYDLLAHAPLAIVAEAVIPVPHCLVGLAGTNIDALTRVHSHPAALAQCRRFLSSIPDTLPEVAQSTPAAARRVAESGDQRQAAIASRRSADKHGLVVLLNDVSDHAQNYTRFVAVAAHTRIDRDNGSDWRTAVRFVTHHHPGALASAIQPLAEYGVNMTSLQSRPIHGRPWDYQFYADLEGHPLDAKLAQALRNTRVERRRDVVSGVLPGRAAAVTLTTAAPWSDLLELEQVVARSVVPAQEPRIAPLPDDLHPGLRERLEGAGITSLYSHQAEAYAASREGSFVVVTGTASGKSLAFNLPVLQALAVDPKARAIYLYPTKALAQDQARSLAKLGAPGARPALYDGDTAAPDRRAARAHANLLLTNPDMLHAGILPRHAAWGDVLHNLEWVVVDEAHAYRGVFGAHVVNVMARLRRLCRSYGSQPRFAVTSATIANPREAAERLAGGPVTVVDRDGSPAAEREIAIWNPPLLDELLGVRASTLGEAATLLAGLVSRGVRTIVFAKSRAGCELVYRYAREGLERHDPGKARRLAAYRAGYTPEDRRRIERALADGELLGVVATNALELGIDIGHLDCAVSVGFPGSTASLRQQWGRAGRRRAGLGIYVAAEDALDQYFARHPDQLLGRPVEAVVCNPQNPSVQAVHLLCAAAERPLVEGDAEHFGEAGMALAAELPELVRTPEGLAYRGSDHPSAKVSLRTTGSAVAIVEGASGAVLGLMEESRAHSSAHPGAIHLHQGEQYLVTDLDLDHGVALVRPFNGAYYTQAKRVSSIAHHGRANQRDAHGNAGGARRHRDARAGGGVPAQAPVRPHRHRPDRAGAAPAAVHHRGDLVRAAGRPRRTTCWGHCMPPSTL